MSSEDGGTNDRLYGEQLRDFARGFTAEWAGREFGADELVDFATRAVPHTVGTGLTLVRRDGRPTTLAASNELAALVDALEYEAGEGPCLDALEHDDITVANDLATDRRWPTFCERAVRETPIRSMVGARVHLAGDERGALNFYAKEVGAFNEFEVGVVAMLSTLGSLALQHATQRRRADNLETALETSRRIGMAMGVLMSSKRITADRAFEELRRTSQETNRKLRDIALEVTETGALPEPRPRPSLDERYTG